MDQPKIVKIVLIPCLIFAFCLFISACAAAFDPCYFTPCYQGAGFQDLFKIDGGRGLQVVCMSLLCITHTVWVYLTLFKSASSDLKYGMVVTMSGLLGLFLICQTGVWLQKSLTIKDLVIHEHGAFWYEGLDSQCELDYSAKNGTIQTCPPPNCGDECEHACVSRRDPTYGNNMVCEAKISVNSKQSHTYDAVSAFSCMLAMLYMLLTYLLLTWKGALGDMFSAPDFHRASQKGSFAPGPRASRVITDDSINMHNMHTPSAEDTDATGFQEDGYQDQL